MQSESIIIQHAWIFYRLHVILLVKQINKMSMTNAISQHDTYLSGHAYYRKKKQLFILSSENKNYNFIRRYFNKMNIYLGFRVLTPEYQYEY